MINRFKPKEADRSYLFAVSFVGRLTVIVVVSAVVGALVIAYFLERDLTKSYSEAIFGVSDAVRLLVPSLIYSALFQVLVAIPVLALAVVLYTHKVVGPIFRFTTVFREVAHGGLKQISRLRQNDQLRITLESINEMKLGLTGFVESCDTKIEKIEELVGKLESAAEPDKSSIVRELREEAASLGDLTGKLKLGGGSGETG